jgi:chromosome segregation ATPase
MGSKGKSDYGEGVKALPGEGKNEMTSTRKDELKALIAKCKKALNNYVDVNTTMMVINMMEKYQNELDEIEGSK